MVEVDDEVDVEVEYEVDDEVDDEVDYEVEEDDIDGDDHSRILWEGFSGLLESG